ncbi:MAG: M23 family metallopeptidase [Porphyromonadaceae bacterium]|nr:M23 family metallopeptidase [Porphyromonadaceae bacterium]
MAQKKNLKTILERWKFRYKLFILNETTLEEVFRIKISRLTIFLYGFFALIIVFVLMSVLIIYSPLKYYLPGFSDYSLRSELSYNMAKIDSLSNLLDKQTLQLQTTKNIITGTLSIDSIPQQKDVPIEKYRELVEKKSDKEIKFVENFQQNISLNPVKALIMENTTKQNLAVPLAGTVVVVKDSINKDNGIKLTSKNGNVLAMTEGVVTAVELTLNNRYVVVLQHLDGYLSIYKNIAVPLKKVDEKVNMSDAIGLIALDGERPYLIFELWQNSTYIDPYEVFDF